MEKNPPLGVSNGTPRNKVKEVLRADILKRLRNSCADWSTEDFEKLVDDMTSVAIKYLPPQDE